MNSFLAVSLGLCLSLGMTWLFARKCARWLDDSWWSREFGIQVWLTVIWSVFGVILPMRNGFANFSHGLIPVGLSPSPRPRLRVGQAARQQRAYAGGLLRRLRRGQGAQAG